MAGTDVAAAVARPLTPESERSALVRALERQTTRAEELSRQLSAEVAARRAAEETLREHDERLQQLAAIRTKEVASTERDLGHEQADREPSEHRLRVSADRRGTFSI